MQTSTKEDLINYIKESRTSLTVLGAFFLLASGFMGYLAVMVDPFIGFFALFGIGCSILLIWSGHSSSQKFAAYIQDAESSGKLQELLNDFSRSYSMVGDNIRLGSKYIYGKKKGRPVSYSEIRKVYQYRHRTNFVEDYRQLQAVVNDGSTHILCDLKLRGKSDEDVAKIMGFIYHQNPNVHLGYN